MTTQVRKILFYVLVILFLAGGGGAIFYSQGWRFSFTELAFQRTGAIFVQSAPRDARISLEGLPVKNESGILQAGTLIDGLLPQTYSLRLERDGFLAWEKQAAVLPELVTKYEHIILMPQKEATTTILKSLTSPLNDSPLSIVFDAGKNAFLLKDRSGSPTTPKVTDISALFRSLRETQLRLSGAASLRDVLISPSDPRTLILISKEAKSGLYLLRTDTKKLQKISSDSPVSVAVNQKEIIWSNERHSIVSYNFSTTTVLYPSPFTQTRKIAFSPSGDQVGLLEDNDSFYLLDRAKNIPFLLSSSTKNFEFSPDNQKVALIEPGDVLRVYDFSREKTILMRLPSGTSPLHLVWHGDSEHLFVVSATSISFTEVDDALPLNIYPIAKGTTQNAAKGDEFDLTRHTISNEVDTDKSVLYRGDTDAIYFLKGNTLFEFSFEENVTR